MVIVRVGPVYGWFTEGFDTLDLKVAKAFCLLFSMANHGMRKIRLTVNGSRLTWTSERGMRELLDGFGATYLTPFGDFAYWA